MDASNPRPRIIGFARLLEILGHGSDPEDHTSINMKPVGDRFKTVVRPSRQVVAGAGTKAASEWPDQTDVWFGVNPLVSPQQFARKSLAGAKTGRGAEADVRRLVALYADLDFKESGLVDRSLTDAVVEELADAMDAAPHVEVETGGGLHLYWILDEEIKGRPAKALLRRFGRMVADVARKHGGKVDSVFDLARVLRVPGSDNWKTGEPRPVVAFETPGWTALTIEEVEIQLDRYGIPTEKIGEVEINGGPVLSAPAEWEWAEQTCPYVATVLDEWPTDEPIGGERHRTIMAKATRLAAFWRAGCITEADYDGGVELLRDWLEDHRPEEPGEVDAAVSWGIEHIATRTTKAISTELGHDPKHPEGRDSAGPGIKLGGKRPKLQVVEPDIDSELDRQVTDWEDRERSKIDAELDEIDRQLSIDLGDYDEPEDDQQQAWAPEDPRWDPADPIVERGDKAAIDEYDGHDWADDPELVRELTEMPIDLEDLADPEEDNPHVIVGEIDASKIHGGSKSPVGKLADRVIAEPTAERTRMLADALVEMDRLTDNELGSLVVFLATIGQRSAPVVNWKDPEPRTEAGQIESKARLEIGPWGAALFDSSGETIAGPGTRVDYRLSAAGDRCGAYVREGQTCDFAPNHDGGHDWELIETEMIVDPEDREALSAAAERSLQRVPASPRSDETGELFEPGSSPIWHLSPLLDEVDPALFRCDRCGGRLTPIGRSKILADCTACY